MNLLLGLADKIEGQKQLEEAPFKLHKHDREVVKLLQELEVLPPLSIPLPSSRFLLPCRSVAQCAISLFLFLSSLSVPLFLLLSPRF